MSSRTGGSPGRAQLLPWQNVHAEKRIKRRRIMRGRSTSRWLRVTRLGLPRRVAHNLTPACCASQAARPQHDHAQIGGVETGWRGRRFRDHRPCQRYGLEQPGGAPLSGAELSGPHYPNRHYCPPSDLRSSARRCASTLWPAPFAAPAKSRSDVSAAASGVSDTATPSGPST